MITNYRTDGRPAVRGGVIAGLIAGAVIGVFMLFGNLMQGIGVWQVFKGASAPFLGDRVLQPGFDAAAVLLGTLGHFTISAIWGALFGLVAYGMSRNATIALGLAWGIVVWAAMYFIVLPAVGLGTMARFGANGKVDSRASAFRAVSRSRLLAVPTEVGAPVGV